MSYSQPLVPGVTHPAYTGYPGHWGAAMPYHHGGYGGYHDYHHGYPYHHYGYPYHHHHHDWYGSYGHPY